MGGKRLILLGAGHAHLLLTERLAMLRGAGLDPLLIAPRWFDYSGLATGVLSGSLPQGANRIDVAALAARRGLPFVEGVATTFDSPCRALTLADGSSHRFDLLSLNIGSGVEPTFSAPAAWPVKPLNNLADLRRHVEATVYERGAFPETLIVGSGPSGVEVAAALTGLAERLAVPPRIVLAGRSIEPSAAWRSLRGSLERRGVVLRPEMRVSEVMPGQDLLIAATGLRASRFVEAAGLATEVSGGIAVGETLQSTADPAIFAVGDCAHFLPRPLPRLGVFGVRQAPVLARNLAAFARGSPLAPYRPQRHWLSILDLGNGEGFATWDGLACRSRAMLRLKRHLDEAFMRRFR